MGESRGTCKCTRERRLRSPVGRTVPHPSLPPPLLCNASAAFCVALCLAVDELFQEPAPGGPR